MKRKQLLRRLTQGALQNVAFTDMVNLVEGFGFRLERTSGSHHIFRHSVTGAKLNLQPYNGEAKPYQIRQFLRLVERLDLKLEDEK